MASGAGGFSLDQILAELRGDTAREDYVEVRMEAYLEQFCTRAEQEKRAPTRCARSSGGPQKPATSGIWWGRSVLGITYANLEDCHLWLGDRIASDRRGKRRISAKTQKNASDAFRTFLCWCHKRDKGVFVPDWPTIEVPDCARPRRSRSKRRTRSSRRSLGEAGPLPGLGHRGPPALGGEGVRSGRLPRWQGAAEEVAAGLNGGRPDHRQE